MKNIVFCFLSLFLLFNACKKKDDNSINPTVTTPVLPSKGDPIPYISINSSRTIVDEPKVNATLEIRFKDSVLHSEKIAIEIRGAISQLLYEKKSYGFELQDDKGNGISKSLLGLPEEEDWILHGPYGDKSLIRNAFAYQVANSIGRYAPRTKFVELEINGSYKGLYVFMEKLKRDKNRINLKKLEPTDIDTLSITGGYILKLDKTVGEGSSTQINYNDQNSFHSQYDEFGKPNPSNKTYFLYEYPKMDVIIPTQKAYIKKYVQDFEASLASKDFSDDAKGFRSYIDEDSFIDFFILTELMQNFDGYRISTYLQKERGERLKMGPIWDFDLTLGSNSFCAPMPKTNVWIYQYNNYCGTDTWLVPFWWNRLLQDKKFVDKLKSRWTTLRKTELSENALLKIIDEQVDYLNKTKVVTRNFEKWNILNTPIVPNPNVGTHEQEITTIKNWLKARITWLDSNIVKL
jgi:CotH kinase protein